MLDSPTTTASPDTGQLLELWRNANDAARARMFDQAVADGSLPALMGMLMNEYPDQDGCYRLACILKHARLFADKPAREPKLVASYYHTLTGGGIETSVAALVQSLARRTGSIALIDEVDGVPEDAPASLKESIFALDARAHEGTPHHQLLADAVATHGVDLLALHAWFDPALLWAVIACKAQGASVVLNVHGVFSHFLDVTDGSFAAWNDGRMFALVPAIARLCDAVVCQNETTQAFFAAFNPRSVLVRHSLPASYLEPLPELGAQRQAARTLLWVGRFDIFKHPEDAIRILAKVHTEVPDARLIMCGESGYETYEAELAALAAELGVADSVQMLGFTDPRPYYDQASVLISTTEVEGFCMVLAEACARGLPVVSYDLPYLPFAQCAGMRWVAQGDIDAAAHEACMLLADEAAWQEASATCRSFAHAEFDPATNTGWDGVLDALARPCEPLPVPAPGSPAQIWETLFEHFLQGQRRTRAHVEGLVQANAQLAARAEEAEARTAQAAQELDALREEYEGSASYRVGRALLTGPRLAKGLINAKRS